MSQFFKKFSAEDTTRLTTDRGRFIALGAFGKHPGWDDHIEDLGLETETLTLAKRILYIQGVGGQIDTGAWEKLAPPLRTEGFDHCFLWQRGSQFLLGRLWSSSDGKGRTRYPMVVCAHCAGVPLGWGLDKVLPRLAQVQQACQATNTAADVRSILDQARTQLRTALGGLPVGDPPFEASPDALARFVADPAFGAAQDGWFRILYHINNQMAVFSPGRFNLKGDLSSLRAQHLRVPLAATTKEQALLLWSRFFTSCIDGSVPVLLALNPADTWLDVVVGEPSTQDLFCLRATPAALPLITEVPYEISDTFKAQTRAVLADFQSGRAFAPPTPAKPTAPPAPTGGGLISWFKGRGSKLWLLLVGVVVVLAAAVTLVLTSGEDREPQVATGPSEAPTRPTPPSPAQESKLESASPATAVAEPPQASPQPTAAESNRLAAERLRLEQVRSNELAATQAARLKAEEEAAAREKARLAAAEEARVKAEIARSNQVTQTAAATDAPPAAVPAPTVPDTKTAAPSLVAQTPPATEAGPPASQAAEPGSGSPLRKVLTNSIGMVLVWVAGLPGTAQGAYVGKYEVTQKEFQHVMKANPSSFKNDAQPVENVSWQESLEFCQKLTALEHDVPLLPPGFGYALPTVAQWEFFLGDAKFEDAVTSRQSPRDAPAAVGTLAANQFGLADVLGNVWEFCSDSAEGSTRILKGGAYNSRKVFGESASQWKPLDPKTPRRLAPEARLPEAGFRCVATSLL